MADIGSTLRDARMNAGIDITEVEARTKIRAKYLRALENEEWSLLPGSTFVKSFLRTYADFLGLDGRLLVEEYKFRHEPFEASGGSSSIFGGRKRKNKSPFDEKKSRFLPFLLALLALGVFAFFVVRLSKNDAPQATNTTDTQISGTTTVSDSASDQVQTGGTDTASKTSTDSESTAGKPVFKLAKGRHFNLVFSNAKGGEPTYLCVVGARGGRVVNGLQLKAGKKWPNLRSSAFLVSFADTGVKLLRNGKQLKLKADDQGVISYELSATKQRVLPADQRPACSQ